jgi:hypothetical protein
MSALYKSAEALLDYYGLTCASDTKNPRSVDDARVLFNKWEHKDSFNEGSAEILNLIKTPVTDFMAAVTKLDELMDTHVMHEVLEPYLFDMLMASFLSEESKLSDETYLDSPEWLEIEEATSDRGSEFLNLMVYLNDCKDQDIEPNLDDFLDEFLMVDEEDFQDEANIYESLIRHRDLEAPKSKDLVKIAVEGISEEMEDLFVPVMSFFSEQKGDPALELISNYYIETDSALYAAIRTYRQEL